MAGYGQVYNYGNATLGQAKVVLSGPDSTESLIRQYEVDVIDIADRDDAIEVGKYGGFQKGQSNDNCTECMIIDTLSDIDVHCLGEHGQAIQTVVLGGERKIEYSRPYPPEVTARVFGYVKNLGPDTPRNVAISLRSFSYPNDSCVVNEFTSFDVIAPGGKQTFTSPWSESIAQLYHFTLFAHADWENP